jgi:aspartate/methionine/tyrosine aminotransferase
MTTTLAQRLTSRVEFEQRQREDLVKMAASMPDVIRLNRGDPDLPTPPHILEAAARAAREGKTKYTHWQGIPELRQAIAAKLRRDNNLDYAPDEIIVTAGAQEALFVTALALIGPGDEVLMGDPHYTSFSRVVKIAGGAFVPVPTRIEERFMLRAEEVERRLTPRSKVLAITTPDNPTGVSQPRAALERLAALAQRANLLVMSDEIYEKLLDGATAHFSIGSVPGMKDRVVVINGFSKAYRMTGLRLGYLAAPGDVIERLEVLKANLSICPPSVAQWAGLAALEGPQDSIAEMVATFKERRQIVMDTFDAIGVPYVRPDMTMHLFANFSLMGMTSMVFSQRLLEEEHVLIAPGTAFGTAEGYVRLSWLAPTDRVREAMDRLRAFVDRHQAGRT